MADRSQLNVYANPYAGVILNYSQCAIKECVGQNVQNYMNKNTPSSRTHNSLSFFQKSISTNLGPPSATYYPRQRYAPYFSRSYSQAHQNTQNQTTNQSYQNNFSMNDITKSVNNSLNISSNSLPNLSFLSSTMNNQSGSDAQTVTLQIGNLDLSLDENAIRHYLMSQLKPITPIISLTFEGSSSAKIKVPSSQYAKLVVAHLHRRKIGHKRMVVSYTRDSSSTELNTLRCQVAGLLKDVPGYTLPMYKFRELFQSRFKTSINVLDLYRMQDICNIVTDKNEEKMISLHNELISSIQNNNPLVECLQHSVPYCAIHFKKEQYKGWAEQEIEPLPNVLMSISQVQNILLPLLKMHKGDIPIASLLHCIEGELDIKVMQNDNGVNLEHLICCVGTIQIKTNNFGIKILSLTTDSDNVSKKEQFEDLKFSSKSATDPLNQISREVIELIKMSPKSTLKFNRFIPAYHNHFGKQCRVADYGYTRLIELFEALSSVVQVMGEGEDRLITLTHKTQIRRFTTDLLRILRAQANKSVLLSQLTHIFTQTQNRLFDVTDYGVCDIVDILDGLVNSNAVVVSSFGLGNDIVISIPKRKQSGAEIEKTCIFAGEVVELFRNASQYSILFQKFVRSYHYHFGFQCRLCDYGFLKLADLMEAISGVVDIDSSTEEDRKIYLCPKIAQRVFSEQLQELVIQFTGNSMSMINLNEILNVHKSKYGYQIQPQTLGYQNMIHAINSLPFIEMFHDGDYWIICHQNDRPFRNKALSLCSVIMQMGKDFVPFSDLICLYSKQFNEFLSESTVHAMKHVVEIKTINGKKMVSLTPVTKFIINLIKIFERKSVLNISDLKSMMNITVSTCFEFGYPNVSSLIQANPDIFKVSNTSIITERSDIELNPTCILTKRGLQNYYETTPNVKMEKTSPEKFFSSFGADDCQLNKLCSDSNCKGAISKMQLIEDNNNTIEANNNNAFWRPYLTTCLNQEAESFYPKLYERRGCDETKTAMMTLNNNSGDGDSISSLRMLLYEPPKPDTPPSKIVPFWIDPIWANIGHDAAVSDSLNIHMPEFQALNLLPVVLSPCSIALSVNQQAAAAFAFEQIENINQSFN